MIKDVYVDMDNVCVDFYGGVKKVFGDPVHTLSPDTEDYAALYDMSKLEFWTQIHDLGPEFWRNLKEYEWTKDLLGYIELDLKVNWKFLTALVPSPWCAAGKLMWMQDRYGKFFRKYHLTTAAHKGDCNSASSLLIDDKQSNCDQFDNSILFPHQGNLADCSDPLKVVMEQLKCYEF